MQQIILEFAAVTAEPAPLAHSGLQNVDLCLHAGAIALIRLEPGNEQMPLADMAQGLLMPDAGVVRLLGQNWAETAPEKSLPLRATIGRVFEQHGWISNLNINENITLSQRHHTLRPLPEILAEATLLARAFGLGELPAARPAVIEKCDLRRWEWVRAFLGKPRLILLERPMRDLARNFLPNLIKAVAHASARGAAILWLTDNEQVWQAPDLQNAAHYTMHGQSLCFYGNKH